MREYLCKVLTREGYKVTAFSGASSALAHLSKEEKQKKVVKASSRRCDKVTQDVDTTPRVCG